MLAPSKMRHRPEQGTTMLEVLVTIVILAFGMLGLAGLQSKIFASEMESYQRAQAVVLMNSMVERINANRGSPPPTPPTPFGAYVTGSALGTGDSQPSDCSGTAIGVARDKCEWSNALKGAAETSGSSKVGAMIGARGCVTQIQAADPTLGVCTPGIYLVTVAWQGLNATTIPSASCGQNAYGSDDRYRRALSTRVVIGLPSCQ